MSSDGKASFGGPAGPAAGNWNAGQTLAIDCQGNLLVSASAGTGKTAVLVERVIRRVTDQANPVKLDRLLVVTFTDAAAAQMKARTLGAILDRQAAAPDDENLAQQIAALPRAEICTLHSFCLNLVRRNFHRLGLDPALRVMDQHEAELLLHDVLDDILEARYDAAAPDFLSLVAAYGGDRGDEQVRGLALELLAFARTQPQHRRWLRDWATALSPGPSARLDDLLWAREVRTAAAGQLQRAVLLLQGVVQLCSGGEGLEAYLPQVAAELADVESAVVRLRDDSVAWDALGAGLTALDKKRLRSARGDGAVREAAKAAQKSRGKAWAHIASVQTGLLSRQEAELLADLRAAAGPVGALVDLVLDLDQAARETRLRSGRIDFPDFEYYALQLLGRQSAAQDAAPAAQLEPTDLAMALRQHYVEVLVDEYQDINRAQDAILHLVSDGNLVCVGDVKQSIYRFRGTDPAAFERLRRRYEDVSAAGNVVDLVGNYRSRPSILAAVNFLCSRLLSMPTAEVTYGSRAWLEAKAQVYSSTAEADVPVEVYLLERGAAPPSPVGGDWPAGDGNESAAEGGSAPGEPDSGDEDQVLSGPGSEPSPAAVSEIEREARLIGRRILRMVQGGQGGGAEFAVTAGAAGRRPVRWSDIAVLLRAVQGRANRYLEVFADLGIPARAELASGYFVATEVETMLALLRIIDNPRQDIPLAAVLRSPLVGLPEPELACIRLAGNGDYFEALLRQSEADGPAGVLARFLSSLDGWRTAARRGPLGDLVWSLLQDTGYLAFVGGLPGGGQRRANLLALHDRAREFDRFARQGLSRFLRFVERLHETKRDLGAVADSGAGLDAVLVTSVHKAKGLEFPVVFLPDMGKRFHGAESKDVMWHADLGLGPRLADREAGIRYPTVAWEAVTSRLARENVAEELRILYVALTRARERLIISGSLPGLPDLVTRWRTVVRPGAGIPLPEPAVAAASSPLEWICGALLTDAAVAHRLGLPPAPGCPGTPGEARWSLYVLGAGESLADPADETVMAQGPSMTGDGAGQAGAFAEELESRVGWRYGREGRYLLPAKLSVTEVARLADLGSETEETAFLADAGEDQEGWPLPGLRSWQDRPAPAAAGWGTVVHQILRNLNPARGLSGPEIAAQVAEQVARGLLPTDAALLSPELLAGLAWFFGTEPGRLYVDHYGSSWREVPFTMAVPAARLAPLLAAPSVAPPSEPPAAPDPAAGLAGEVILVQGAIDCLLRTPDGLVLLDFKTDSVSPRDVPARAARYQLQIELYAEAAAAALGQPVVASWLVFLRPRQLVLMPAGGRPA